MKLSKKKNRRPNETKWGQKKAISYKDLVQRNTTAGNVRRTR